MRSSALSASITSMADDDEAPGDPPAVLRELAVAGTALTVLALVVGGWSLGFHVSNAHNGLLAASFTGVGLYVLRMRPGHREGRLFVAVGVLHTLVFFGRQYGASGGQLPAASWIAWLGVWPLPLAIAFAGWTLMAFPDGRLASRRWRVAVGVMLAAAAALAATSALWPVDYQRTEVIARHPFHVAGAAGAARFWPAAQATYLLFQVLWTIAIVDRIRKARDDEAHQMRWLVYAAVVDVALLLGGLVFVGSPAPGLFALPLIPVAAGAAILKHRLYDIDPVIDKTVVLGVMVLAITLGYVAIVLGLGALVPAGRGLLWLATTAVVAIVSEPLRRRAQRLADRLVYGDRPTPYEALAQLSACIDEGPGELLKAIATAVGNSLDVRAVEVWAGPEERLEHAAGWPSGPLADAPRQLQELHRSRWHVRTVSHHGVVQGALALRKASAKPFSAAEERLLSDLTAQTALVIVQQRQAEELQAAARRIVAAEDAARRRIERDLHDGAQQRLVTLGLDLGALAEQATADPALASRMKAVRDQLLEATSELRELARGLHPMVLTEQGLRPALEALADRAAVPVRLRVSLDRRLPADVEATAYFVVSEALTNAARHAAPRLVTVGVGEANGALHLEVVDDGMGGARQREGHGLQGLADRLAAIGAQLHVDSPPGGGTRITTVLPCG